MPIENIVGKFLNIGDAVGQIGPTDENSKAPHIHLWVGLLPDGTDVTKLDVYKWIDIVRTVLTQKNFAIDFVSSNFYSQDETSIISNTPMWPNVKPGVVWQAPPSNISIDGIVQANEWPASITLTDAAGDSQTGKVMDFTSGTIVTDTNNIYLLVKAGQPSSQPWIMLLMFNVYITNACGADYIITIDSTTPNKFVISTTTDCKSASSDTEYSGLKYVWNPDGTLEILLPYAVTYIGSGSLPELKQIVGYVKTGAKYVVADSMPDSITNP